MKLMLIDPTTKVEKSLTARGHSYEIVKSPAEMERVFHGRNGIFDGIIVPAGTTPEVLAKISENWYVKQRELPIWQPQQRRGRVSLTLIRRRP